MAMTITQTHSTISIGERLATPFKAIGRFMISVAEQNSRTRQVEFLRQLPDAELARRGIKREDIVRHVFADVFYR